MLRQRGGLRSVSVAILLRRFEINEIVYSLTR